MLAKARRTIKKLNEYNRDHVRRTCKSRGLTLKLVHKISRDTVMQRLDLIRIRLLRLQLAELHKIKAILEQKIGEQERHITEQRELDHFKDQESMRQWEEQDVLIQKQHRQIEEQQQQIDEQLQQINSLRTGNLAQALTVQTRSSQVIDADSTFNRQDSENQENLPPSVYNTPDEERPTKEQRCETIDEEERDDLIPDIRTPPRNYPRQSIGQWSVERAKNNLSVRSLVSSLEDKTGSRKFSSRNRMMR